MKRIDESMYVCNMIKNVIKTRLELRKKNSQKSKSKVITAKKLLNVQKKRKLLISNKSSNGISRRFVLDVNVNVKLCK